LKNLAGNEVSIFLFQFKLRSNGIEFILNEGIAADMYPDLDEKMKPIVHTCCETLLRYKYASISNLIMDGHILVTGEFEVMLSKGLGRYFIPEEKERLFQNAKNIADILEMVMSRRTLELNDAPKLDK